MSGAAPIQDVSNFYSYWDQSRQNAQLPLVGQIVYAPVLNCERVPTVADAVRSNQHSHGSADLDIRAMNATDFQGKPNRLPIAALHLRQTEELIVSRAKKRPCLVV